MFQHEGIHPLVRPPALQMHGQDPPARAVPGLAGTGQLSRHRLPRWPTQTSPQRRSLCMRVRGSSVETGRPDGLPARLYPVMLLYYIGRINSHRWKLQVRCTAFRCTRIGPRCHSAAVLLPNLLKDMFGRWWKVQLQNPLERL